jgi:acetyl esterase/lipase
MLVAQDICYYQSPPDDYAAQKCTVHVHRPDADNYPVFVYFHGGGLEGGGRGEGDPFVERMIAEGFGVVTAEYRVSPQVKCPTYQEDAAAAVAWTIENIADYGGDPTKLFVTGHSAGGYLTAIVCLDDRHLAKFGHHITEITGSIPTSGQMLTHFTIRRDKGLPFEQATIDEDGPLFYAHNVKMPMFLLCGGDDMAARVEENALMAAVRKANDHDVELLVVPGRDHGTIKDHYANPEDPAAVGILAFVRRLLA